MTMEKRAFSNIKLGILVTGSLIFLVLLLYMVGKNQHLFGSNFMLKAKFENVQGLVTGNNVRFAGIESGTVKAIDILNDSTVEVTMMIDKKLKGIICKNAIARIGTEGFVGNKVVNIIPAKRPGPVAEEGEALASSKAVDTDEILQTFAKTNNDIAIVASGLKDIIRQLNSDNALWPLLHDRSIPQDIKMSLAKLHSAANKLQHIILNADGIISNVKKGRGTAGMILTDSTIGLQMVAAISKITDAGMQIDSLTSNINQMVAGIRQDVEHGNGAINALLRDSLLSQRLNEVMENIRQGTDGFNQNMEALKHNIFFRGYFRKLEKQKQKESKSSTAVR